MSSIVPTLTCTIDDDLSEKLMQRRERAKLPSRNAYAIVVAVAILLVGLLEMYGVQRRQKRNALNMACTFLNIPHDLNFCLDGKTYGNANSGLVPTIPSEIGLMSHMTELKIYGDAVSGTIPPTMGNLTQLGYLEIIDTQVTGTIPSTFGNLIQLRELIMIGNHRLTGTIPPTLGNLTNLDMLYISNTQLVGPILSTMGNLVNLTELDLGYNQLTGTIPSTLVYLTHLKYLFLQNNTQLSGEIPSSLCSNSKISIYVDCDNIACSCCRTYNPDTRVTSDCSAT